MRYAFLCHSPFTTKGIDIWFNIWIGGCFYCTAGLKFQFLIKKRMHSILYVTIFYRENGIRFDSTIVNNEFYKLFRFMETKVSESYRSMAMESITFKQNKMLCTWRKLQMVIFGVGDNEKIMVIIVFGSMHFQMNPLRYFAINPPIVASWHAICSLSPLSRYLIATIFLRSYDFSVCIILHINYEWIYSIWFSWRNNFKRFELVLFVTRQKKSQNVCWICEVFD